MAGETATYTMADLTLLRQMMASGELKSKHGDRYVEYRSLAEMKQIEADMVAQLFPKSQRRSAFKLRVTSGL